MPPRIRLAASIPTARRPRHLLFLDAVVLGRRAMSSRGARSSGPEKDKGRPTIASPAYCLSCGRLMPHDTRTDPTPRRYCSAACRGHAKDPSLKPLRQKLAQGFHMRLQAGSSQTTVLCSEVENDAFGSTPPEGSRPIKTLQPAEQREEARRAARRLVAFGFVSQGVEEPRPVESVQNGKLVETSFAKGEWGIRWKA